MHDDNIDSKGVIPCLALFYGHKFYGVKIRENGFDNDARLFLASDHLTNMEIPEHFPELLRYELKTFKESVLNKKKTLITWEEGDKLFEKCKNILLQINNLID